MQDNHDDGGNDFSDIECAFQDKTICENQCYDQAFQVYDSFKTGTCVGNACLKSKVYRHFSQPARRRLDGHNNEPAHDYNGTYNESWGDHGKNWYGNGSSYNESYGGDYDHGNGGHYGDGKSGDDGRYGDDNPGSGVEYCEHPWHYAGQCQQPDLFFQAIKYGVDGVPAVLDCLR